MEVINTQKINKGGLRKVIATAAAGVCLLGACSKSESQPRTTVSTTTPDIIESTIPETTSTTSATQAQAELQSTCANLTNDTNGEARFARSADAVPVEYHDEGRFALAFASYGLHKEAKACELDAISKAYKTDAAYWLNSTEVQVDIFMGCLDTYSDIGMCATTLS